MVLYALTRGTEVATVNRDYRKNIQQFLGLNIVPIMFVGLCLLGVRWSGKLQFSFSKR